MISNNTLTAELFVDMIHASVAKLEERQTEIDAINVFPVPDGDTGANLFMTVRRVVEELKKSAPDSLKAAVKVVAKGSFLGARGNSGVILSQFFMGFSKAMQSMDEFGPNELANAFTEGSIRAYQAGTEPVEGTILTGWKEIAHAAEDAASHGADWNELMFTSYEAARISLARTPDLLPRLKEAGVVDAGAQGFVFILDAWVNVLKRHNRDTSQDADPLREYPATHSMSVTASDIQSDVSSPQQSWDKHLHHPTAHVHELENLEFRFCTEAVCETTTLTAETLRGLTRDLGDSLNIAEIEGAIRIHIHTNEPERVFEILSEYGEVPYTKAEDMLAQHQQALQSKYLQPPAS